jgi:hypothetical protein
LQQTCSQCTSDMSRDSQLPTERKKLLGNSHAFGVI